MPIRKTLSIAALITGLIAPAYETPAKAAGRELDSRLHHVRAGSDREWSEFPGTPEAAELLIRFDAKANPREGTLQVRQRDVKQIWKVLLNDRALGTLVQDENDQVTLLPLPAGALRDGENVLRIACARPKDSDDVYLGEIGLDDRSRADVLDESTVEVSVRDGSTGAPTPCRLTVVNQDGALAPLAATSSGSLAVRTGVVYTATGQVRLTLPRGRYTIHAGRGFEYGIDMTEVDLTPGAAQTAELAIRREVATPGYVACDTHCHTRTHSGHGDATIAERMATIAGEGIELPIATDHNVQIDYEAEARAAEVRQHFTPVTGNEVTTPRLGHFNVFPIAPDAAVIDHTGRDWDEVFDAIWQTPRVQVVVLNHARDLHGGFRPFGPKHHISIAGENLDGRTLRANAMELINSGANQTDPLQLYTDWFGLLNRGLKIAPVAASDSHDVARHFVGQGRTYIRCDDADPGVIDVRTACQSFSEGRVLVSLGLLCELTVNGRYGPGDLVPSSKSLDVSVRVSGPSWSSVDRIILYANGVELRTATLPPDSPLARRGGLKWEKSWSIPAMPHDVHLVAVASGPGIRDLFWPIAKPYQPTSPDWIPRVLGSTGVVWVDADASGAFESARDYSVRAWKQSGRELPAFIGQLSGHDAAVAAQAASLLAAEGIAPTDPDLITALKQAAPAARQGFDQYASQWRESMIARSQR